MAWNKSQQLRHWFINQKQKKKKKIQKKEKKEQQEKVANTKTHCYKNICLLIDQHILKAHTLY